jgi:hypothetical protein
MSEQTSMFNLRGEPVKVQMVHYSVLHKGKPWYELHGFSRDQADSVIDACNEAYKMGVIAGLGTRQTTPTVPDAEAEQVRQVYAAQAARVEGGHDPVGPVNEPWYFVDGKPVFRDEVKP